MPSSLGNRQMQSCIPLSITSRPCAGTSINARFCPSFLSNPIFRCITSTPSNKFSSAEASCLTNCVDRFMDTSLFLIKSLQNRRESE
ncbi:uncharacterized protein BT62DRAFT_504282 [Guyanagaster necrorhizus]|uniref:Mitochondrial import inner membrane translocase subunit n=1 Tax=Guyanagaster necrorhizus TaxID=856835 RepID=A0A9P7W1H6_9AGAR|nr:uncharacterized protein BT62DRAFT_504282 [Guyanagaster necrorhizus MCA 3950]KAG7450315.1 hypothetical protein BT62DRAFT_504282 [Guyanagaster necrorhizus MCA 3950]